MDFTLITLLPRVAFRAGASVWTNADAVHGFIHTAEKMKRTSVKPFQHATLCKSFKRAVS